MNVLIRPCDIPSDTLNLTDLLHRAYAPLAGAGLRFFASHQTAEDTEHRLLAGDGFVAEWNGQPVGTITVRRHDPESEVAVYRDPGTFSFGQFAVEPALKGKGIGRALHQHILSHAVRQGARAMALDTASPAAELIAMYEHWGYLIVARHNWGITNYESVILVKTLML